jgi:hypothetical protein
MEKPIQAMLDHEIRPACAWQAEMLRPVTYPGFMIPGRVRQADVVSDAGIRGQGIVKFKVDQVKAGGGAEFDPGDLCVRQFPVENRLL